MHVAECHALLAERLTLRGRPRPPERVRQVSRGFDPALCGFKSGANPDEDLLASGLRIPPQAQVAPGDGANVVQRYLFQCSQIGIGRRARLVAVGCFQRIGVDTNSGTPPIFPLVQQITTAGWRFSDTLPTRWGVRVVRKPHNLYSPQNPLTCDSFSWRQSDTPALLFETATFPAANLDANGHPDNYCALTGYTSPTGGVFPGEPVGGSLGVFDSIDFPGFFSGKQTIEPIELFGPGQVILYCLVSQTNPATRPTITVPASFPVAPTNIPEDGFVTDWPNAINWSVGGWLQVER